MIDLDSITHQANVNGYTIPYYDLGEGPAVLLLHGFPDSKYLWRKQLGPLAEAGFRVIAPDLRGYGDASKPEPVDAYKIPEVQNDLITLLDLLQIEKAHIVGHDWGGSLAWYFVGKHPERSLSITGLTVGAPGTSGRRTLPQLEKLWYIFFFQNKGAAETWLQRDNWQGLRKWTRENGDFQKYQIDLERPEALTAALNWYRANFSPNSMNASSNPPRIKVPAMGISAEYDDYLLEDHVKGSDVMLDSSWKYHRIRGASHWLMLDKPEELNQLLIEFLTDL